MEINTALGRVAGAASAPDGEQRAGVWPGSGPVFTEAFPVVSTPDLPRLIAFYRDVVGFEQTYQFPSDGDAEFVALRLGTSEFGLAADPKFGNPALSRRWELCIYADDCDTAVQVLRAGGATVIGEPADQPWGERSARVKDPDGNTLLVLSRL